MAKKSEPKAKPGEIKVRCTGTELVDLEDLVPFQGKFKEMSPADLSRLKLQLTRSGIAAASTVWKRTVEGKKTLSLLDGHQRREALLSLTVPCILSEKI